MSLIPIWLHEYNLIPLNNAKGIKYVTVHVVTESEKREESFDVIKKLIGFVESEDLTMEHKIRMIGYMNGNGVVQP